MNKNSIVGAFRMLLGRRHGEKGMLFEAIMITLL